MKWKFWSRTTRPASEQRQTPRIIVSIFVVVGAESAHYVAETGDLSETGLCLHTGQAFPVGTSLRLVFGKPPELPKVDVQGVVKWAKKGQGVGIEFTSINPEDRRIISHYMKSRNRMA